MNSSFSPPIAPPMDDISDLRRAINELIQREHSGKLLTTSSSLEIRETPDGKLVEVIQGSNSASVAESNPVIAGQLGMIYRGEWHSGLSVNAQDVFVVSSGPNAGLYVATEAMNAGGSEPGSGGNYVRIGDVYTPSLWS